MALPRRLLPVAAAAGFIGCAGDPAAAPDAMPGMQVEPPDTMLVEGPAEVTRATTAVFMFTASDGGAKFDCSLDGAAWSVCLPPLTLERIGEGEHVFAVRARGEGGADPSPASLGWRVDLTAPQTTISSGPQPSMAMSEAVFQFQASEDARFECALDGAAAAICESGVRYSELGMGRHDFTVRAVDQAANGDESPAAWSWTVTAITPNTTITKQPASPSQDPGVDLEFTSSVAGGRFECRLNKEDAEPCSSPKHYDLDEGEWTFEVVAIDAGGRRDPTPARIVWTIRFPFW